MKKCDEDIKQFKKKMELYMKKCVIYDDDFKQFKKKWNYIYEENIVERPSYDRQYPMPSNEMKS